jgi:hypothetical protein
MKYLLLFAAVSASVLLTGCDTVIVERNRHYSGGGYYSGGYYGHRHYGGGGAVVVVDRPGYRRPAPYYYGSRARVSYSSDKHGRYYWRNGHKVYVSRW